MHYILLPQGSTPLYQRKMKSVTGVPSLVTLACARHLVSFLSSCMCVILVYCAVTYPCVFLHSLIFCLKETQKATVAPALDFETCQSFNL